MRDPKYVKVGKIPFDKPKWFTVAEGERAIEECFKKNKKQQLKPSISRAR